MMMMMMMKTIQERVRQLRERKGMSIAAICAAAGVGTNTWLCLERYGILPKRQDTRQRIAAALDVDVDDLFGFGIPSSEK